MLIISSHLQMIICRDVCSARVQSKTWIKNGWAGANGLSEKKLVERSPLELRTPQMKKYLLTKLIILTTMVLFFIDSVGYVTMKLESYPVIGTGLLDGINRKTVLRGYPLHRRGPWFKNYATVIQCSGKTAYRNDGAIPIITSQAYFFFLGSKLQIRHPDKKSTKNP